MRRFILTVVCLLPLVGCTVGGGPSGVQPTLEPPTAGVALPPAWTPTTGAPASPISRPTAAALTETPAEGEPTEVPAVRLRDLPGGYTPAQPITYKLSPALLSAGVLTPKAIALFQDPASGTLLINVAGALSTPAEEQGFKTWLDTPTILLDVLAGILGQVEGASQIDKTFPVVATASSAANARLNFQGVSNNMQLVLLREGQVGAYLVLLVPRGKNAGFSLPDLARGYAGRLGQAESGAMPAPPTP